MSDSHEIEAIPCPWVHPGKGQRFFFVPKGENRIAHGLRTMRQWEYGFLGSLYSDAVKRGGPGSFLDVGANFGSTSVIAADFFSMIHGFEMEERNCLIFAHTMQANGIPFRLYKCAVSDYVGDATAYISGPNAGGHSLVAWTTGHGDPFPVRTIALDRLAAEITDARFIHVDTEGHDLRVLAGAHDFIRKQTARPTIQIEFTPLALRNHGSKVGDLFRFMDALGYQAHMNAGNVCAPLRKETLSAMFEDWRSIEMLDLILIPQGT